MISISHGDYFRFARDSIRIIETPRCAPHGMGTLTAEPPSEGNEVRRRCPMKPRLALGSCSALSGRRERTDRNAISVRISERELLGLSVRIHVWLLFEASDERACPLKR
jgi:hypothetical protein